MIILLACLPKSGSTFIASIIGRLPGFVTLGFSPSGERREQEIDTAMVKRFTRKFIKRNCIAQHHVRASRSTIRCIEQFEMQPIVLVRNLYDAIVSLSDHLVCESPEMPFAYFDESFAKMEQEKRIEAIVDLAAPWYFNFYVSWWHYRPESIVTYEDVVLAGKYGIRRLIDRLGLDVSDQTIDELLRTTSRQTTRYNVGVAGRGESLVSRRCKEILNRYAEYYPLVDFSPLGLRRKLLPAPPPTVGKPIR